MTQVGRSNFNIVAEAYVPTLVGTQVKIAPDFFVEASELKGALFVGPAAGSASTFTVTFASTYVAGDTAILTITSNATSRSLWRKSYDYTVVTGDTVTTIAAAFAAQIYADGQSPETPYSATSSAGVLTVTAKDNDKRSLRPYVKVVSSAGTMVASSVSTTISEGQPQDLIDHGVPATKINLASYDTVRIIFEPRVDSIYFKDAGIAEEIYWYGTPGNGAAFALLINSL